MDSVANKAHCAIYSFIQNVVVLFIRLVAILVVLHNSGNGTLSLRLHQIIVPRNFVKERQERNLTKSTTNLEMNELYYSEFGN
jgi:hypothetical protein